MENVFKKFNENFFSKSKRKIKWFDKQGVYPISNNRVVTITIDDVGTRDHYNGYTVEIINTNSGSIIKKFFRFYDHLTMIHRDSSKYYHVWSNSGNFEWYISRPKDTNEMCKTIFEWIDSFE